MVGMLVCDWVFNGQMAAFFRQSFTRVGQNNYEMSENVSSLIMAKHGAGLIHFGQDQRFNIMRIPIQTSWKIDIIKKRYDYSPKNLRTNRNLILKNL